MPTMLNTLERNQVVTEQEVLLPLTQVIKDISTKPDAVRPVTISKTSASSIQDLFPEQEHEEKSIKRAKEILGELAGNFTNSELHDLVAQVEYLAESWLDNFETDIFSGKTLNELLHERGGL